MSEPSTRDTAAAMREIELQIKELERDKLRAEIREASLAWWQRPGYIASTAPILLAIVGIFSAWVTGFFNREREFLKTDIARLTETRVRLDEDNKKAQKELADAVERTKVAQRYIDEVYVKVSYHSAGTRYALSHVKPEGQEAWIGDKELREVEDRMVKLPEVDQERLRTVIEQYRIAIDLIDGVHQSMHSVEKLLSEIPASPRAKRLQLTVAPDHDFEDPVTKKTYSIVNIDEFLKGTD